MKRLRTLLRWMARLGGALALLYAGFFAFMYWQMTRPPAEFGAVMSRLALPTFVLLPFEPMWFRARAGALQVGDLAPDFRLPALDGKSTVSLSAERGARLVVLIFGSYT